MISLGVVWTRGYARSVLPETQLFAFAGIVLLAAMSPGPDFVIVTRYAAVSGRRSGVAAALGIACGVFVWAVVAAFGVAALLAASAVAFTLVKLVGAAYLAYLGIRSLLAARRSGAGILTAGTTATTGLVAAFRQGLLTNLLNPKCAVFFVALMPQFAPADDPRLAQTLLLSVIAVVITAIWFTVVANVVGGLRRLLASSPARRAIDAVTGAILVGLGVRLAVQ
jgi:RhtB (resistance to homoserine/threonine) family protein